METSSITPSSNFLNFEIILEWLVRCLVKALATESDGLSLVSGTHMVKGEIQLHGISSDLSLHILHGCLCVSLCQM